MKQQAPPVLELSGDHAAGCTRWSRHLPARTEKIDVDRHPSFRLQSLGRVQQGVCICCAHAHACMDVCVRACYPKCIPICTCVLLNMYRYVYACVYIHMCVRVHAFVCVCLSACMCASEFVLGLTHVHARA